MEGMRSNHKIELAREFILNTRANIYLTGKAGTGKTTMLRNVVGMLGKRAVIAAPTGVAALNAGGVTLHSLFQLPFGMSIPGATMPHHRISRSKLALIRSIELLIIDEVSMVRCDMLDAIDQRLRSIRRSSLPFAGVQLLLIGDIQQLAPICREEEWEVLSEHYATPYFFDSKALQRTQYVTIEFDEIFRQSDSHFTTILNAVRENRATREVLDALNERHIPDFEPRDEEEYITLTTHNNSANSINRTKLMAISRPSFRYTAKISGDFSESAYPNDSELELKEGAQVLFIKNDISPEKRYYNGLIGRIIEIDDRSVTVAPQSGGEPIRVEAVSWDSLEYNINKESGEMEQTIKGSFTQIPLRCAWAITIHKSQGLSFDRAIIDASSSFAHGQVYVALSRCRSLEGMVLRRPISATAIIGEQNIDNFCSFVSANQPSEELLEEHKRNYYKTLLCEIFSFETMQRLLWDIMSEMSGPLSHSYPKLVASLSDLLGSFDTAIVKVGGGFQREICRLVDSNGDYRTNSHLRERLHRAAEYFTPRLTPLVTIASTLAQMEPDSAETKRRLVTYTAQLTTATKQLILTLKLCDEGFSVEGYLEQRAKILALDSLSEDEKKSKTKRSTTKATKATSPKRETPTDIIHQELYDTLAAWRREEAEEMGKPSYCVAANRTLMEIQSFLPTTAKELSQINGMGKVKMDKYADQLLEIVNDYCFNNNIDPRGR